MSATPRPTWYAGEYGCRQDMYAASVALPIFNQHDALVAKAAEVRAQMLIACQRAISNSAEPSIMGFNVFGGGTPVRTLVADVLAILDGEPTS